MTCRDGAARPAQQAYQRITGFYRRGRGAGLIGAACAVHFARRDPRDAEMRSLGAPDGAIAVPDMGGRASEGLPCSDDRGGKNDKHQESVNLAQRAAEPEDAADDIDGALFETAPTRIGGIVAQHRDPLALRFDRHALDVEHVIHAHHIDSVAQARLAIAQIDHHFVAVMQGGSAGRRVTAMARLEGLDPMGRFALRHLTASGDWA